ncbi:EFCB6 protein, partial [Polyodon spathula]|nr:EFCB6 protein [Polyodon spathula]
MSVHGRLGDPDTISLRGFSKASSRNPRESEVEQGRPLANEGRHDTLYRSQSSKSYRSFTGRDLDTERVGPLPLQHIPEGVEVIPVTDPNKTRLPIFGQQADIGSRAESRVSQTSSRASTVSRPGTQLRIEVDELEHLLREKMRAGGYFTMRQLFKNNDPEAKGQVNRDVLLMVLTKLLGRFISSKQYQQLLLRLQLSEKTIVKFEELYAAVRDPVADGAPAWLNTVNRYSGRALMTASQVHAQLKEKTKQRFLDLAELLPQKNPGGASRIVAPEFQNMLNRMGFHMEEEEFEKLWKRYDKDGLGAIKGDVFLKRLGIDFRNNSANHAENAGRKSRESMNSDGSPRQSRTLSKAEEERKASITIEKWLKDKFREGFKNMKIEFEKYDPGKTHKVQQEDFLCALEKFDLHLKKEHVNLFLARCGLENKKSGIDYAEFLKNFQDRSERGVTHRILSDPQHKFNQDESITLASSVTAIEAKLTNMFQSEFLSLLATFHKIDKLDRDIISQPEFRAAVESRFNLEITDEEFEQLLDRIPLDDDENIRYPQFMAMFDSRKGVPSLFDVKSEITSTTKSSVEEMKQNPSLKQERSQYKHGRTPGQLFGIIKTLVNKNYQAVEKTFEELDENNTKRLTQEAMYQLLKGFDIHPEVSRGEIRRLWETLITNQDKTLDFLEFVRHFGYSPKSACFPNAKISPPKKGDDNFRLRSKKLNCASDILVDSVRAKVEYLWDDLQKEFDALDPYHTGFVTKEEFKDILTELCVQLNAYECDMLEKKFEKKGDGRVSYLEFLKPFALQRQMWRNGTNMAAVLQHSHRDASEPPAGNHTSGLDTFTTRLRNKLQGEWKNLCRAFKKLDSDGSGFLSITKFKSVLKLCNLVLDEDEVYHILSKFDHNMDGHIEYNKFLEEACKKETAIGENIE